MSESIRSIFISIVVFVAALIVLAIISPTQFQILADAFSESGELILVLVVIAVIVFILKMVREK